MCKRIADWLGDREKRLNEDGEMSVSNTYSGKLVEKEGEIEMFSSCRPSSVLCLPSAGIRGWVYPTMPYIRF